MPSAGRMRPNTVSAGSWTTPRQSPVSTITFSSTLVKRPKNPFRSPGTQSRGVVTIVFAVVAIFVVSLQARIADIVRVNASAPGSVRAPAAVRRDLGLTFAKKRLAQNAEHDRAVAQYDLADRKPGRLVHEEARKSVDRHVPKLERDARALAGRAHHGRVPVTDRPQPVARIRFVLAYERRADRRQIRIELEPAHQRAVHRNKNGPHAGISTASLATIHVPVSPRSARAMFSGFVITPRPPRRRLTNVSSAST